MYSDEELTFMELQLQRLIMERERRKEERRREKGFGFLVKILITMTDVRYR